MIEAKTRSRRATYFFLHLASLKAKIIEVVADGLESAIAEAGSLALAGLEHAGGSEGIKMVHALGMLMLLKFKEYTTVLVHCLVQ